MIRTNDSDTDKTIEKSLDYKGEVKEMYFKYPLICCIAVLFLCSSSVLLAAILSLAVITAVSLFVRRRRRHPEKKGIEKPEENPCYGKYYSSCKMMTWLNL